MSDEATKLLKEAASMLRNWCDYTNSDEMYELSVKIDTFLETDKNTGLSGYSIPEDATLMIFSVYNGKVIEVFSNATIKKT